MNIFKILILCYLILTGWQTYAQNDLIEKVNNLQSVTNMPYICRDTIGTAGCGQTIFWSVVTEKLDIVPHLLNIVNDTTATKATVSNFGGEWTVADIAYTAIQEIINDIPTFELLGIPFDTNGCGYCAYWSHLRQNVKNRQVFKNKLKNWYEENKDNLEWVESNAVFTCDCSFTHPNGGHYQIKKANKKEN